MADDRKIHLKARANNGKEFLFLVRSGVNFDYPLLNGKISAGNVISRGSKVVQWARNVSGVLCCVRFAASDVFG